jgi:hypothetical protein
MTSGTTACQVTANVAADSNYTAGSVGPSSVTASQTAQTVSWSTAPPPSAAYNGQFTVLATSNSTGAITYSVTGGCTNSGATVTMISGTTACQVTANVAADSNYTAGSVGPTGVSATKASPTVSWSTAPPPSAADNSQFTVVATSNSTGTISYSTSGGCSNSGGTVTMTSGTTACQVTGSVTADNNYAAGSVGPTSVTATKIAPTVSWSTAPPASAAYNGQFTVVATSNSTGAITYSTSGGCTNSGGTVTMTSSTTACQVTANVAADSNYSAGSVGPTGVSATKATATVTLSNLSQSYTGSALYPGVTTVPASLAVTWTNAPQTGVGSYTVSAAVNDPNYQGSSGNQTFNITDTAPTVTQFKVLFGSESYNVIGTPRNRLPWQITGIQVVFSKPITSGNINSLTGVTATALSGLGTSTLTWTISPLVLGNYPTTLASSGANALKDAAGTPIAAFSQNVKVLWADFNDDGVVNSADSVGVNNATVGPYNIFADLNGDGVVNASDVAIVRTRLGTSLP